MLAFALLTSAHGQALVIEEITVTATKRAEGLQDVPISLSVIEGEKITEQGFGSLESLVEFMPNVNVTETSGDDQLFIRGIGSGGNSGFEQSVGTFVDGVYRGRSLASRQAFLDLERVEVLRGPQNTLFGKNTVAGALNISTANPTEAFESYLQAAFEPEFGGWGTTAVISGPLGESLGARLAVRREETDGYFRNHTLGRDERAEEDTIARLTLAWAAADALDVNLKIERGQSNTDGRQNNVGIVTPRAESIYRSLGDLNFSAGINHDKYARNTPGRPTEFDDSEWSLYNLTATWDIGRWQIRSITGYVDAEAENSLDLDFSPLQLISGQRNEYHEQFTQELIVTGASQDDAFEFIGGVFYQDEDLFRPGDLDIYLTGVAPLFASHPLGPLIQAGFGDTTLRRTFTQESQTLSSFAQVTWQASEAFSITAGLRYSEDEKELFKDGYAAAYDADTYVPFSGEHSLPHQAFYDQFLSLSRRHRFDGDGFEVCDTDFRPVLMQTCRDVPGLDNVREEDHWTGDLIVEYHASDDVMAYLKIGTGYKAGGFDERNTFGTAETEEFDDETVDSYEIGAKMTLLDGRARVNVAAFRNEFTNLQVSAFTGLVFVTGNAAESTSQGVEIDGQVLLTEELFLGFAWSYLDSTYDSFEDTACHAGQTAAWTAAGNSGTCLQDLSGEWTQFAPEWSGNLSLNYAAMLSPRFEVRASLDLQYSDDYQPVDDNDPANIQDAFTKINARVELVGDDRWSVALLGKNLTDETVSNAPNDIPLSNVGFLGSYFYFTDPPRSVELQLGYRL